MRRSGFTLLEVCVALATVMVLMGTTLGVVGEMTNFLQGETMEGEFTVKASMALGKLEREIRKTGSTVIGGTAYPQVGSAGAEFHFVRLADPPTAGHGSTELLWDPTVYTVRVVDGILGIWSGGIRLLILCTGVNRVDVAVSGRRVTVDLELSTQDARGVARNVAVRRMIVMRNNA